jgi:hypothetical protein
MIILPRQARDKHNNKGRLYSLKNEMRFRTVEEFQRKLRRLHDARYAPGPDNCLRPGLRLPRQHLHPRPASSKFLSLGRPSAACHIGRLHHGSGRGRVRLRLSGNLAVKLPDGPRRCRQPDRSVPEAWRCCATLVYESGTVSRAQVCILLYECRWADRAAASTCLLLSYCL